MKITVIGTGYVGLVAGTCLADMGNTVICVDKDSQKIQDLTNGVISIYEPGLEELIKNNVSENRLSFTDNISDAIQESEVCFIAVGTPPLKDGSANLEYIYQAVDSIAESMTDYKLIINKSTVPVGTLDKISEIIKQKTSVDFDVASNPEFLKQGNAVNDFLHPDRIIVGTNSERATNLIKEIYEPFIRTGNRILFMDIKSAEMTKYAANAFLATKISFINELANLCEKIGANIDEVRMGISLDSRIGNKFLFPGLGYGGSCFPKDVQALIKMGADNNYSTEILKATNKVNILQREFFIEKIKNILGEDLTGKTIAIWGLSFKPKTNDLREAPSITIINELLAMGAKIKAFDPKAMETAKLYFEDNISYSKNSYECLTEANALLVLTEWNEFRRPDFEIMKSLMKQQIIFDGRNLYDTNIVTKQGFKYFCIGK